MVRNHAIVKRVTVKRFERLRAGSLWVFASDIREKMKDFPPGEIVGVYDAKEHFYGTGYINPHSLIAVRILSPELVEFDTPFFTNKIKDALTFRKRFIKDDSFRLVYSESDGLPGLIADKYNNAVSIQILTAGMEQFSDMIVTAIDDVLNPDIILLKNESRAREQEGLPLFTKIVKGSNSIAEFSENGVRFRADLLAGQKTGFFLDQRDNRAGFAGLLQGKSGLDLFCYHGGWGLQLLKSGNNVTFVDSSEKAIQTTRENVALNSLEAGAKYKQADVFDFLKTESAKHDFIVFDPPAFIKSKSTFGEGYRAYRDQNAKCMKLLSPGGLLATSSCSHHMQRETFVKMISEAAAKAGRRARLLALKGQPADHPVLLAMPETEYLKCAWLAID